MGKFIKLVISILFVVTIIGMIIYVNLHPDKSSQTLNIFDEMYSEVKSTYQTNNILRKIKGFEIRAAWPNDNDLTKNSPYGEYERDSLPSTISDIGIQCSFDKQTPTLEWYFDKVIDKDLEISILMTYEKKSRTVQKSVTVINGVGDYRDQFIRSKKQVKVYLDRYHITAKDLDTYYDQIVNKKILKDWCSVYDSKFSPSNYGKVKIETQWKDW